MQKTTRKADPRISSAEMALDNSEWLDIGSRLRQARLDLSSREGEYVRQDDVALATGMSQPSISAMERNDQVPEREALVRLAAFLEVDPGWLMFGTASRAPKASRSFVQRFSGENDRRKITRAD